MNYLVSRPLLTHKYYTEKIYMETCWLKANRRDTVFSKWNKWESWAHMNYHVSHPYWYTNTEKIYLETFCVNANRRDTVFSKWPMTYKYRWAYIYEFIFKPIGYDTVIHVYKEIDVSAYLMFWTMYGDKMSLGWNWKDTDISFCVYNTLWFNNAFDILANTSIEQWRLYFTEVSKIPI